VSGLIGDRSGDLVYGEKKVVTVFFSDLQDFTGISERFTPGGVVKMINHYLTVMSEPVTENKGIIDKYIGDAIMAFWTTPFCEDGEKALLAVDTALKQLVLLEHFKLELPDLIGLRRDLPRFAMRIGIATGDAIVGSIGSERIKNYTVMGDTVNVGARLEGANKIYGTSILVCERTYEMASGEFEFRKIDHLVVKGKTEPISIYEPLGPIAKLSPEAIQFRDQFEQAFSAYHEGEWDIAKDGFLSCQRQNENDSATATFLNRISAIQNTGVPDDWDGVWHLDTK
jgi:adenylate cyclase